MFAHARLYMLEEQCNTWQGITSVAVYFPLFIFHSDNADRLREAITTVENFHEQIDRSHGKMHWLLAPVALQILLHQPTPRLCLTSESLCVGLVVGHFCADNHSSS